jgi:toxin YhaV
VEINGWCVFAHPRCLDQIENLIAAVKDEAASGKSDTGNVKVLRAIHRFAFVEIPKDPANRRFRLGDTIGPEHRHWFRAKFGAGRFRLFFRFQSQAKIIVLGWVNDRDTLRTRGAKADAYAVFQRMLDSGNPPDSWHQLLKAASSEESPRRLRVVEDEAE